MLLGAQARAHDRELPHRAGCGVGAEGDEELRVLRLLPLIVLMLLVHILGGGGGGGGGRSYGGEPRGEFVVVEAQTALQA